MGEKKEGPLKVDLKKIFKKITVQAVGSGIGQKL